MSRVLCWTLAGLAVAAVVSAAERSSADIAELDRRFHEVRRTGDPAAIKEWLHPDFVWIGATGQEDRSPDWRTVPAYTLSPIEGRTYGDAGITTAVATMGAETPPRRLRYVRVWVRMGGGWRLVLHQSTRMGEAVATSR